MAIETQQLMRQLDDRAAAAERAAAPRIAVVIPCYRERDHVLDVIARIPAVVANVICVDDGCPDRGKSNVQITDNVIVNLKTFRRGIGTWNNAPSGTASGAVGDIRGPLRLRMQHIVAACQCSNNRHSIVKSRPSRDKRLQKLFSAVFKSG